MRRLNSYETKSPWHLHRLELIKYYLTKKYEELERPLSIIDIGCGTGEVLSQLKDELYIKSVEGIEINTLGQQICRNKGLAVHPGDIENLPLLGKHYDVILCLDVFYDQTIDVYNSLINFKQFLNTNSIVIINSAALNIFSGVDDSLDDGKKIILE